MQLAGIDEGVAVGESLFNPIKAEFQIVGEAVFPWGERLLTSLVIYRLYRCDACGDQSINQFLNDVKVHELVYERSLPHLQELLGQ